MDQSGKLSPQEVTSKLKEMELPWMYNADTNSIERVYNFESYQQALDFINKISKHFQRHNHHPKIEWYYGEVVIKLNTTSANNTVTAKDITVAGDIEGEW
jgi:4a-hydroxytetrahydrobiopterin dehydratase